MKRLKLASEIFPEFIKEEECNYCGKDYSTSEIYIESQTYALLQQGTFTFKGMCICRSCKDKKDKDVS